MYKPLVSIVIPVYKGGNYMREAIDSALAQTYENIEIIVINDGSPDDGETERIALEYGDKIRYFHKENGGCASALNYGISKMRGEWFSWLSHDDLYMPDKIKEEIEIVEKNGYDGKNVVISCGTDLIDSNGNLIFRPIKQVERYMNSMEMFKYLMLKGTFGGCGLLIPKNVLDVIGEFSCEYKYILDWEYWIRMSLNGVGIYVLDKKLTKNRIHRNQVTISHSDLLYKENLIMTKRFITSFQNEKRYYELKVMLIFCSALGLKEEVSTIKSYLKENGQIVKKDLILAKIYWVRKNFLHIVKQLYKMIIRR